MISGRLTPRTLARRSAMRPLSLFTLGSALATQALHAQAPSADTGSDVARLIGLGVAASGGPRDTLGLLVASVTRDSPADQAGLTMGSRILAVNGYLVRLNPAEIGQRSAADTAMARFDRALRTTPSGGSVALRIIGFGRTRTVTVPVPDGRVASVRAPRTPAGDAAPRVVTVPAAADPAPAPAPAPAPVTMPAPAAPADAQVATPPTPAPRPVVVDAAPVAAPSPAPAVAAAPAPQAGSTRSTTAVAELLGQAQLDLRRLSHETKSLALSDSLAELDAQIGALRRRLQAIAGETPAAAPAAVSAPAVAPAVAPATAPAPAPAAVVTQAPVAPVTPTAPAPAPVTPAPAPVVSSTPVRISVDGLELSSVSGELAAYIGPQASSALVVNRASEAWEPMRAGDVILQVDGAAPDATGLRIALESRRHISVLLLRRGRSFTVTFGEQQSP